MSDETESEVVDEGYLPVAQALEASGFTLPQLRSLTSCGIIRTKRAQYGGALLYCSEDLHRFDGMPKSAEEAPEQSPLLSEFRAVIEGFKALAELSLKQTKQAQDHERMLITAFSKPLENLGDSSKSLVTAVLDQNKQLVTRANEGDVARLDFVKAAETMLRDQRQELREQAELDRKHQLRQEMWEGVKKAAPHLLDGVRKTLGSNRLEAASQLAKSLDPAKLAMLIKFELLDEKQIALLCEALELDRAELDRINAETDAAEAEAAKSADTERPPADAEPPKAAE